MALRRRPPRLEPRPLMRSTHRSRSDGRCATAGCEYTPSHVLDAFCKQCETARRSRPAPSSTEPSLFDPPAPTRPRAALPEQHTRPVQGTAATSKKAAAAIERTYHTRKTLIHEHIKGEGARGATRPEIAAALGLPSSNSVNSAANTLYRQGLIGSNPDHERADPNTGNMCMVLVDEIFVTRWQGKPRHARTTLFQFAGLGECDLVHPETGAPMTERDADALQAARNEQGYP